jgi:6-phosphogluconolactonase (cycloisomerase 2 family)
MTFSPRRLLALVSLSGLLLLTSCGMFFYPENGGGGNSTCTTNCVYIANSGTDDIAAFADTNPLSVVSSVNVGLDDVAISMAVTPNNDFLYAGSSIGNIYMLPITGGSLGSPTTAVPLTSEEVRALTVDPAGADLLAAVAIPATACPSGFFGALDVFSIDSTGTLTEVGTQATSGPCGIPTSVAVSPNGNYIFMGLGTGGVEGFTFVSSTGIATQRNGLSFSANTTTQFNGVAVDPQSTYLFVSASGTDGGLAQFQIKLNGTVYSLTQVGGTQNSGGSFYPVAVNSSAAYLYTADYTNGEVYGYSYGSGGLTAISGSPFSPSASASGVNGLVVDSSGSYVLTVNQTGPNLQQFTIGTAGALTASSTGTTSSGSYYPSALAITR